MPWSPLNYVDNIFERLKSWGIEKETTSEYLLRAIMLETKLIRPETIKNLIMAMERLGYLERKGDTFVIKYWEIKSEKI